MNAAPSPLSRKRDVAPLWLAITLAAMYALIHLYLVTDGLGASAYNTFTRQALAWREGLTYLKEDVPHLELAVFGEGWYVCFPPVPTIPMWLLSFFFGMNTPDNLIVKVYALCAALLCYRTLKNAGYGRILCAVMAALVCAGSSLLAITLNGAVWYLAQALALALALGAVYFLQKDKPTACLLCFALAVGCRPPDVFLGGALILCFLLRNGFSKASLRKLLPGMIAGLCVAAGLAIYNYIRFGDAFEFGYSYMPEYTRHGDKQFSIAYLWTNIQKFVFGLPFSIADGKLAIKKFGFSVFLANPLLLLLLIYAVIDLYKKRMDWRKGAVCLCFLCQLTLLLMHRTFGSFQFGARYGVDLLPYAVLYLALSKPRRITLPECALCAVSVMFNVYGSVMVSL